LMKKSFKRLFWTAEMQSLKNVRIFSAFSATSR